MRMNQTILAFALTLSFASASFAAEAKRGSVAGEDKRRASFGDTAPASELLDGQNYFIMNAQGRYLTFSSSQTKISLTTEKAARTAFKASHKGRGIALSLPTGEFVTVHDSRVILSGAFDEDRDTFTVGTEDRGLSLHSGNDKFLSIDPREEHGNLWLADKFNEWERLTFIPAYAIDLKSDEAKRDLVIAQKAILGTDWNSQPVNLAQAEKFSKALWVHARSDIGSAVEKIAKTISSTPSANFDAEFNKFQAGLDRLLAHLEVDYRLYADFLNNFDPHAMTPYVSYFVLESRERLHAIREGDVERFVAFCYSRLDELRGDITAPVMTGMKRKIDEIAAKRTAQLARSKAELEIARASFNVIR